MGALSSGARDIFTLVSKDFLLLWRDRSLLFIFLLWLAPLGGLLKAPSSPELDSLLLPGQKSQPKQHHHHRSGTGAGIPVVSHSWFSVSSDGNDLLSKDSKHASPARDVVVGVIGKSPDLPSEPHFKWRPMKNAENGIFALQQRTIDLLLEAPDGGTSGRYEMMTIVFDKSNQASKDAAGQLHWSLRQADSSEKKQRIITIGKVAKADHNWLLATLENHYDRQMDETPGAIDMKLWGIAGALMLAAALAGSLVMLIMVEENSQHTLPLILVCSLDRRTIFSSKLLFCLLPTLTAIASAVVKLWRATPVHPADLLSRVAYFATAFGAASLFVTTAAVILVACGGRSRNNIEAVAKVGGPLILMGFLVITAVTPLSPFEPGLAFLPLSNLILCLNTLRQSSPNVALIAVSLICSFLLLCLLLQSAPRALRCEEGLSGDVGSTDPKLDGLLIVLLSSIVAALLQTLFATPLSIVFPSTTQLAPILILTLAFMIPFKWRRLSFPAATAFLPTKPAFLLLAALTGLATAYIFSQFSSWSLLATAPPTSSLAATLHLSTGVPIAFLALAVLRACVEELTLRGIFTDTLEDHFSPLTITLLITGLSVPLHPLPSAWLPYLILSAVSTATRLATRSVIPSLVLHATHVLFLYFAFNRLLP